eukprot:scaffold210169_cov20-Prasinocladus_malaysianus.AAC.1
MSATSSDTSSSAEPEHSLKGIGNNRGRGPLAPAAVSVRAPVPYEHWYRTEVIRPVRAARGSDSVS